MRARAMLPGREVKESHTTTNLQTVTQKGNPHTLLDAAFRRTVHVVEEAVRRLVGLSAG